MTEVDSKTSKQLRLLAKWMWLYPPYLGAGISVRSVSADATQYVIQLKQRWYNRNMYGTHFGGSLYSMVDPFFVFAAAAFFGKGYILWDKAATIAYINPGKDTVHAEIGIPLGRLAEMKTAVDRVGKGDFTFETKVVDKAGTTVADVTKTIYIRRKKAM